MKTIDGWVDLPLDRLPLRSDEHLSGFNLVRVPTWDELFCAIDKVVKNYDKKYFTFGHGATVMIPSHTDGRCALYAGLSWAFLANFFKMPCGVGVGGIKMKCNDDSGGSILFPESPKEIDPNSGKYHAWAGFSDNGENYFVDMSYFSFSQKYNIVGPKNYIVSNLDKLNSVGIIYYNDKNTANSLGISSDIKVFLPFMGTICDNLRMA